MDRHARWHRWICDKMSWQIMSALLIYQLSSGEQLNVHKLRTATKGLRFDSYDKEVGVKRQMSWACVIETFSQCVCVCVCVWSWKAFVSEYRSLLTRATSERGGTDSCLRRRTCCFSLLHFIMQPLLLYHVLLLISLGSLCPAAAVLEASVWMSARRPVRVRVWEHYLLCSPC